jgi:hypothetical protein
MRKALTLAAWFADPTPLVRIALACEFALAAGLLATGRAPAALLHALQLFLRF